MLATTWARPSCPRDPDFDEDTSQLEGGAWPAVCAECAEQRYETGEIHDQAMVGALNSNMPVYTFQPKAWQRIILGRSAVSDHQIQFRLTSIPMTPDTDGWQRIQFLFVQVKSMAEQYVAVLSRRLTMPELDTDEWRGICTHLISTKQSLGPSETVAFPPGLGTETDADTAEAPPAKRHKVMCGFLAWQEWSSFYRLGEICIEARWAHEVASIQFSSIPKKNVALTPMQTIRLGAAVGLASESGHVTYSAGPGGETDRIMVFYPHDFHPQKKQNSSGHWKTEKLQPGWTRRRNPEELFAEYLFCPGYGKKRSAPLNKEPEMEPAPIVQEERESASARTLWHYGTLANIRYARRGSSSGTLSSHHFPDTDDEDSPRLHIQIRDGTVAAGRTIPMSQQVLQICGDCTRSDTETIIRPWATLAMAHQHNTMI